MRSVAGLASKSFNLTKDRSSYQNGKWLVPCSFDFWGGNERLVVVPSAKNYMKVEKALNVQNQAPSTWYLACPEPSGTNYISKQHQTEIFWEVSEL